MWQEGEVGSEEGIRMENKSWVHEDKRGEAVVWELVSTRMLPMLKLKPCFRRSAHPAARILQLSQEGQSDPPLPAFWGGRGRRCDCTCSRLSPQSSALLLQCRPNPRVRRRRIDIKCRSGGESLFCGFKGLRPADVPCKG